MDRIEPIIKNEFGEKLDTWVEGNHDSQKTVIMVHGFGTNKHDGCFDDLASSLCQADFRVVRFDFSGYGKSEGKDVNVTYSKQAKDLSAVIDYVQSNFSGKYYLFSQSMGTWVTSILSPTGIAKTVFIGMPNANTEVMLNRFRNRAATRPGASFNEDGISIYPRSSGAVQQIGSNFWKEIRAFNPVKQVSDFAQKTDLLSIHWYEDEILGTDYMEEYESINKLKSLWLHGNHTVASDTQKEELAKITIGYFNDEELVEWVDEDEKLIGPIPIRLANSDPKYLHREIVVLLVDKDRRVFVGKRASTKKVAPNIWIPAAAGHLTYGDTVDDTAHRELKEETGLTIKDLKYMFRELAVLPNETHFAHWFLGFYNGDPITIDPTETSEYVWLSESELEDFVSNHEVSPRAVEVFRRYWAGEWD